MAAVERTDLQIQLFIDLLGGHVPLSGPATYHCHDPVSNLFQTTFTVPPLPVHSGQNGREDPYLDFSLVPYNCSGNLLGCWILFHAVGYHDFQMISLVASPGAYCLLDVPGLVP